MGALRRGSRRPARPSTSAGRRSSPSRSKSSAGPSPRQRRRSTTSRRTNGGGPMIVRRTLVTALVTLAFAGGAVPALAQSYPSRVIKLVVPFTPGSPNDVMARLLTQHLSPRLGQPIVIDNKPGGGTSIGTKAAAAAEPDGYTLLFVSSSIVIDPAMKHVAYDPFKEFTPVAGVNTTYWMIVVPPSLPAKTLAEFVAYT